MTDSVSLPGPSGKGIRTKLGCFTCRARKVKCDLTRPICQTCTRLNLDCTYTKPDKQLNIPRLRRGRKRRTSDPSTQSNSQPQSREESQDRRGSTNTMPDLWRYQHDYEQSLSQQGRMSLDHGRMGHGHGQDLASSAYLNSLLRHTGGQGQTRRESMPVMLPSSYSLGYGGQTRNGLGREDQYRSPTPMGLPNLFNGYQLKGIGEGNCNGSSGKPGTSSSASGCSREVPRSITPADSTYMATPQGWDLSGPSDVNGNGNVYPSNDVQSNGHSWNQPIQSFDPFSTPTQDPLALSDYPYRQSSTQNDWAHSQSNISTLPSLQNQYPHVRSSSPFPITSNFANTHAESPAVRSQSLSHSQVHHSDERRWGQGYGYTEDSEPKGYPAGLSTGLPLP